MFTLDGKLFISLFSSLSAAWRYCKVQSWQAGYVGRWRSQLLGMGDLNCTDFIHVDCCLVPFRENFIGKRTIEKTSPKDDGCKFRQTVFLTASFFPQLHRKSRLFFKYWHQEQLAKYVERLEKAAVVIQKGEQWGRRVPQLSWSQTRARKKFSPVPAPPLHLWRWQKGRPGTVSLSRPCGVRVLIADAHLLHAHPYQTVWALERESMCAGTEQGKHMIWLCPKM